MFRLRAVYISRTVTEKSGLAGASATDRPPMPPLATITHLLPMADYSITRSSSPTPSI